MNETDKSQLHKGHRARLREQYENFGIDSLEDHRILELLLFYSIPRGDTNPIAHRLLDRFGSLFGVMKASVSELTSITGVGKASASLIHTAADLMKRAMINECLSAPLSSDEKMKNYLVWTLFAEPADTAVAVFTNAQGNHLYTEKYPGGEFFDTNAFTSKLLILAERYKADAITIAHTHAGAPLAPSPDDINATLAISASCRAAGRALAAHYIVSDLETYDILPLCTEKK